ncbi:TIGR02300 family protein [Eilatimonas milleporae]|uniref:Uncharacterized protein (TIGR02300 family) n=1 Tax=Eilatimonas milleporae TaxID=911205 RepID=A0A3M0CYE0_9PROT|nr:TIGR02300 family protein [Eilatimonas milleporae]RMB12659.1 uncharacterized protein (TIGR02300 family) [Eilatimonas milleporae]
MAKPEWGTKRTCPKCGTRFYDMQNDDPVTCIECGNIWTPEPILKSKQPLPIAKETESKKEEKVEETDSDLDLEEDEDVLGDVSLDDDDDDEVSGMVDTSLSEDST